jgi:hypothetical protein
MNREWKRMNAKKRQLFVSIRVHSRLNLLALPAAQPGCAICGPTDEEKNEGPRSLDGERFQAAIQQSRIKLASNGIEHPIDKIYQLVRCCCRRSNLMIGDRF